LSFSEPIHLCTKLQLGKLNLAAHLVQRIKSRADAMKRYCPLRVDWPELHSHPVTTSRLAPSAKSGDNGRVRQDAAGPGSSCRMPDGEHINGFKGLRDALQKIEAKAAQ
jgi:hypothetical protein